MRPARVKQGDSLTVLAACFAQRPERAWFSALEAHNSAFSLTYVESRVALVRRARSLSPCVVLLPVQDARGIPSAPLIARLRAHGSNVRVMVLLTPGSSRAGLAEAIRAGGEALTAGSEAELLAGLHEMDQTGPLSVREHDATRALLADIRPAELREMLQFCVMHAHRRLSVANVATERAVSSRKLGRETRASSWPTPSESIEWGRLLRASMLQWRESSSLATLARASGFASVRGLQHSAARLLHRSAESGGDLSPFLVSTLLNRRVQQIRRVAKA
jgi:AraC-like DNA-binding protein